MAENGMSMENNKKVGGMKWHDFLYQKVVKL